MILRLEEVIESSSLGQVNSAMAAKEHSSLPRIGPQEALISTHLIIGFGPNFRRWHAREHTLNWLASNNLWSKQLSAFLKECCVLLMMTDHGD
ncbi:unnamed protein product [Nezara viridula]|uniref:Uncharacterized protein n=1 Tax=Nezara viridula TaxID=85310 RepID=A0A9P0H1B4_NEZVI|nr:unnamed protein product [Nezara viridula]